MNLFILNQNISGFNFDVYYLGEDFIRNGSNREGQVTYLYVIYVSLQVVWDFLDARTGGEPITRNEGIFITNPECEEDRKKYEVQKRVVGQRVTFMLVVNCLKIVNTGRYKCLIQIPGIAPQNWPSKIGYLTVQGK